MLTFVEIKLYTGNPAKMETDANLMGGLSNTTFSLAFDLHTRSRSFDLHTRSMRGSCLWEKMKDYLVVKMTELNDLETLLELVISLMSTSIKLGGWHVISIAQIL